MAADFEIRHGHLFCGAGSGAAGFNDARPDIGTAKARMRCIGGIDVDPAGLEDFKMLTGVAGTHLDLFSLEQYRAFHRKDPPAGWREAVPADIHRAFGNEHPDAVFLSPPCKAFSGLMTDTLSRTLRYTALNELTLRGILLLLEAYKDDPIPILLLENVPLIASRGRHLLDQIVSMLEHYGYVVRETTHDCGELGGLAQRRRRFLMVARHAEKVPPFLYEPHKRPHGRVGDVLGRMPLPGDLDRGGPMHRIPALQWKTWVRLAFVEAGSDWRSLNRLAIQDGYLRDYRVVPGWHNGVLGVNGWEEPTGAVIGSSRPTNGKFAVADPRHREGAAQYQQFGVMHMNATAGAVIGVKSPGQGTFSVADPRHTGPKKHNNEFRIVPWRGRAGTVTGAHGSGQCVSDPRPAQGPLFSKYPITPWAGHAGTVIGGDNMGAYGVADPRSNSSFAGQGKYQVTSLDDTTSTVIGRSDTGHGAFAVADDRVQAAAGAADAAVMPKPRQNLVCRIQSLDGTWHRPFTTLELAALQSLFDPEERWPSDPKVASEIAEADRAAAAQQHFVLSGTSDQAWRERIGNAVPRAAAKAIGTEIGRTLLMARTGQTFALSSTPIWVRDMGMAMTLPSPEEGIRS